MRSRPRWLALPVVALTLLGAFIGSAQAEVTLRRLELVTVTDTTAALTWVTDQPSNTIVQYGTREDRLDQTASTGDVSTRFHHCEIRGLRPGTLYHYVCRSGSTRLALGPLSPGRFKTLVPPPGPEVFCFATMTDTHVGQEWVARYTLRSGKVISEGARWRDPTVPLWKLAVDAAVKEINERNVAFTIVKGDVTDGRSGQEFGQAKRLLSRLSRPCYVVRGNHDRLGPLLQTFGLDKPWYSFDHGGCHFVVFDTEPMKSEAPGRVGQLQLDWLADDLRKHRDKRTFVFVHRPMTPKLQRGVSGRLGRSLYTFGKGVLQRSYGSRASRVLDMASGRTPQVSSVHAALAARLFRDHGRVVGVFAGHLHRNYVGHWPEQTGNLPYVETASTKEYPCGYAITRVFAGGYMQNYYTPRDPQCLEWSGMTRDAYAKIGFGTKVGALTDRNFVVRFDKLDLQPRRKDKDLAAQK